MSNLTMQAVMIRTAVALSVTLVSGCATQPESTADDALSDFVVVSELEPQDAMRFRRQFNTRPLAGHYALLESQGDYYLVQFRQRCHELYENTFPADIRRDRNVLRTGIDTIRGCRIDQIFSIDASQAEELKLLAKRLEDK